MSVHSAEGDHPKHAIAFPYVPLVSDPFPRRPREVICELLAFSIPLDPEVHNQLHRFILSEETFVKHTRAIVALCREGHCAPHLAEARKQNIIPLEGNIDPHQLYRWGITLSDKLYVNPIKQRVLGDSLKAAALTIVQPEAVARCQLHELLESVYADRKWDASAKWDSKINELQSQIDSLLKLKAKELRELAVQWEPVSGAPSSDAAEAGEELRFKLAKREVKEDLVRYYEDPGRAAALADLAYQRIRSEIMIVPRPDSSLSSAKQI